MVAVPLPRSSASFSELPAAVSAPVPRAAPTDWTHYVAAGALLAGGVLLVTGRRRAGVAVAAAGTAIALLEEQDAVKAWWKNLPGYLNDAQNFLDQIEGYLQEASVQGQRIQSILRK